MKRSCALIVFLIYTVLIPAAVAVREIVVIEEPQPARQVDGVVLDPSGAPISGMTVTDRTEDEATVLRSTRTDEQGRFHFSKKRAKTLYYLRFDHPLFNPL